MSLERFLAGFGGAEIMKKYLSGSGFGCLNQVFL